MHRHIIGWVVLLGLAAVAAADESPESDSERIAALEETIEYLLQEMEEQPYDGPGLGLTLRRGDKSATLQFFGDVGVSYDDTRPAGRSETIFTIGGLSIFFTGQLGDHLQVLSETVLFAITPSSGDEFEFDQERLWAAWMFSDALTIKIGLEHGPVSLWNRLYHHGAWLQTTIGRPLLAVFEGGNGFLPMHNSGIEFSGRLRSDAGRWEYILVVSNGRGRTPREPQEFTDRNDGKAVDVGLSFFPAAVEGLRAGFVWRVDDIPSDPSDPARARSIREIIGAAHVLLRRAKLEVMAEFAFVQNRDRTSGQDFDHLSGYLQVSYRVKDRWIPYARIDFRNMRVGDPYLMPFNRDLDRWELLLGTRIDLNSSASLKFEIGFGEEDRRDGGGALSKEWYVRGGVQVSWVF